MSSSKSRHPPTAASSPLLLGIGGGLEHDWPVPDVKTRPNVSTLKQNCVPYLCGAPLPRTRPAYPELKFQKLTKKSCHRSVVMVAPVHGVVVVRINPTAIKGVLIDGLVTALHVVDLYVSHGVSHYIFGGSYKVGITTFAHERDMGCHSIDTF